jgi:hypothetical protein
MVLVGRVRLTASTTALVDEAATSSTWPGVVVADASPPSQMVS